MIAYLLLSVFPAALLIAAANDIYEFKIPNWISILLVCAYPLAGVAVGAAPHVMIEGMLIGAAALALGFCLFAAKIVGGGDAKLLAATAPWLGLVSLGVFLFNTAVAGLVLAMVMGFFRKLPVLPVYAHAPWLIRLHERKKDLPYAVAIAAGALLSFSQTPYFQLVIGG
ncbi:A24 family peptidase [Hyphococcus luteus]|uniref:Pilus assembly protein CpaA n=1 Tax=Hyphococcus luteus TaxID=2058213 RepID=A0A2S7K5R3_9PROT|nr:prepilin peptidase [Marinicaulis flavus]PQA87832.1 pilus assembly protein CpaA [Marinicaulis flavus]